MKQHLVEIYTTEACPYCHRAKHLLDGKGIKYEEIRVDIDPSKRTEMIERTGRKTVPEILIDGELIGGFDDLWAFDKAGKLDAKFRE